jgi:hypothetical protein
MEKDKSKQPGTNYVLKSNVEPDFSNTFSLSSEDSDLQIKQNFDRTLSENPEVVWGETKLSSLAVF